MAVFKFGFLAFALCCACASSSTPPKSYFIAPRPAGAPPIPQRPAWTAYGDIPAVTLSEFPELASAEDAKSSSPSSYNSYSSGRYQSENNENNENNEDNRDEAEVDADIPEDVDSLANFESERTKGNGEGGRDDPFRDVPDADDPTFVTVIGDDPEGSDGEEQDTEGEREGNEGAADDEPLQESASNNRYRKIRAPPTLFRAQLRDSYQVPTYAKPPAISDRFGYANGNEHTPVEEVVVETADDDHVVDHSEVGDGYSQHQPAYVTHETYQQPSYHGNGRDYHYKKAQPYHYQYYVKDDYTHNDFGQHERSDGKSVQGSYRVKLPDGRTQIVTYTADKYNGYQANVRYEGTAHHPPPSYYKESSY